MWLTNRSTIGVSQLFQIRLVSIETGISSTCRHATFTGGYTNKPLGRIGDSPLIGSGTYARDGACAVSGTGQGEYFIRHVLAHDIASRMTHAGENVQQAAGHKIMGRV
jgi:isoaspartyl peptidase/L-asparaginase-like protein (Ntn-hydrolase superfamily)